MAFPNKRTLPLEVSIIKITSLTSKHKLHKANIKAAIHEVITLHSKNICKKAFKLQNNRFNFFGLR